MTEKQTVRVKAKIAAIKKEIAREKKQWVATTMGGVFAMHPSVLNLFFTRLFAQS